METDRSSKLFLNRNSDLLKQLIIRNKLKEENEKQEKIKLDKIISINRKKLGVLDIKPKLYQNLITDSIETNKLDSNLSQDTNHTDLKVKRKKKKKKDKTFKDKVIFKEKIVRFKNCYTLDDWKKKNKIPTETKIFICFSGYPDIKNGLIKRGWVENNDPNSIFFDMLISLGAKNIDFDKLNKSQIVNHFQKNSELTRKVCLAKNLRNLVWFKNVNIDNFFPRCYDLSDAVEIESFIEDFKITYVETLMKDYYYNIKEVSEEVIKICLKITERRLRSLDEIIDIEGNIIIKSKEWEIITGGKIEDKEKEKDKRSKSVGLKNIRSERMNTLRDIRENKFYDSYVTNDIKHKDKIRTLLNKLKDKYIQFSINEKNVWILKPSGLSRGRGIKCVNNLSQILSITKNGGNQYIIQKYIENPLILMQKKFDIRQWVLITDFNPLTIWIYDTPYLRFGAEDYDPDNISNVYSHLTNNSIAKNSSKFESSNIEGNMWFIDQFADHINKDKEDIWRNVIQKKIIDIVINSMESVQDTIINRKNSHEVFGYDLMVDTNLNVWLIEINSSPCMEYSTEITKKLVKLVMEDTLKVIVDYNNSKDKLNVDTGLWKLIHKGNFIEINNAQPGLNLVCVGNKITSFHDEI